MPARDARRTLVAALAMLLVAALAIGLWLAIRYTASPQYSLGKLATALNEGDWAQVQVYADTDAIATDAARIAIAEKVDDLGFDLGEFGDRIAEAAEPALADAIELRMRVAVERTKREASIREQLGAQLYTNDTKRVLIDGDKALVTLDVPYRGREREVDLRMQRVGRGWRVIAIENLEEFIVGQTEVG